MPTKPAILSDEYVLQHMPGYGSDDHLATEVIARAAVHLGLDGAAEYVAGTVGYAPHAVPMARPDVRLPAREPKAQSRMLAALRTARDEMPRRPGCCISVVRERRVRRYDEYGSRVVVERRIDGRWLTTHPETDR